MRPPVLRLFRDPAALQSQLREVLARELNRADDTPHGVLLSGGSTPLALYRDLAAEPPPVSPRLVLGYTDDRLVPPASGDSNYGNTRELIARLGVPPERVLRVRHDLALPDAAADYDRQLRAFGEQGGRWTLALLGLGSDGHTCSLFTPADAARRAPLAIPVQRPDFSRVSVTAGLLAQVERVAFVVLGAAKANILARFLDAPAETPAGQALQEHPRVQVWTDLDPADLATD